MLEALARRAVKLGGVALTGGDGVKLAGLAHDVHRHADVDEAVDGLAASVLPAFLQARLHRRTGRVWRVSDNSVRFLRHTSPRAAPQAQH